MPAALLAVVGALSGGILAAPAIDTAMIAQEETSIGYAPAGPTGERHPTLVMEGTPALVVGVRTRRTLLELVMGPRIYYRTPNLAGLQRPLLLARASARHSYLLDSQLTWATRVSAEYGEVEYSSARLLFSSPVSRPADQAVIKSLDLAGETGFSWNATRTYQLSLAAVGGYTQPLGGEEQDSFRTTVSGGGDMNHRFRIDRRSSVSTPGNYRYFSVEGPDWTAVTQSLGYDRLLSLKTTMAAAVGGTAIWRIGESAQVFPRGTFAIERVVHESRQVRLTNRFAVSGDATYDPLLGTLYPIVGLEASLASAFQTGWSVVVSATAYTPVTADPVTPDGADSAAGISATVGRRLSEHWSIDFGARQSTRATHLGVAPFALSSGETWVFSRLTFTVSTMSGRASGPAAAAP
jgi:hypothetical protein